MGSSDPSDVIAVTELLSRFHHAADAGDWPALESVFHAEVQWRWRGEDRTGVGTDAADGAPAVIQWLRSAMTGSTVRHHTMSHLVTVDGDTATSESYLITIDTTSLMTLASGVVRGRYVRQSDRWEIALIDIDERIPDGSIATLQARTAASTEPS